MKCYTLLFAILFCCSSLFAQEITLGPKAGLSLSAWSTNADDTKLRLAYHAGAFAKYPIFEQFQVQGEILFSS